MLNALSFNSLCGQTPGCSICNSQLCKMPDWPTLPAGRKQQFLPLCMAEPVRSLRQCVFT